MPSNFEKKLFKVAIVNTDEIVKSQARDVGDARMTESKEDRSGNWFNRKLNRIWKHNLAQEWYRQREIRRVKEDILKSGNIYSGEQDFDPDNKDSSIAGKEAMEVILDRFTSEYDNEEILRAGESRETVEDPKINAEIKELIKLYASTAMPQAAFEEEKKRILSKYDKNIASKKNLYADNILSIANEVRDTINQGVSLTEIDFDIEITYGTARQALSTEAHQSDFDKGMEKLQNSKIGKYFANEPTAVAIAAGLYEVGRNVLQKSITKVGRWAFLGLGAAAAGGISAMKERARVTRERAQHQRESAKGMQFKEEDMKRRQEMEKNSYDTKKATIILQNLDIDLHKINEGGLNQQEINEIIGRLADVEARFKLNDEKQIDLIVYDKFNTMEKDYWALREKKAELKAALRNSDEIKDFDTLLKQFTGVQEKQLIEGKGGVEEKDKVFTKLRNIRSAKAFIKTALIGGAVGAGLHEGAELIKHSVVYAALAHWLGGHSGVSKISLHEGGIVDNTHIQLPEGVIMQQNTDDTISLLRDGKDISGHVPFTLDAQGNLSKETQDAFLKSGITNDFGSIGEKTTETIHEHTEDYVKNHASGMSQVHRHEFLNNDTQAFDKDELSVRWGGVNSTGIATNGHYVFNMSHMTAEGSYHGNNHFNVPEGIKNGTVKMAFSFSRGTQHEVFFADVDPVTKDVDIDPQSDLGKLMFENHNGHAVFTGKFAEAVHVLGTSPDGAKDIDIIGTHVGHGKEFIDDVITKDTTAPNVILNIHEPDNEGLVFPIPTVGRRPLERGEYKKDKEVIAGRPISVEERRAAEEAAAEVDLEQLDAARLKELKDTDPMFRALKDQEANLKKNLASAVKRKDKTREDEVKDQLEVNSKAQIAAIARLIEVLRAEKEQGPELFRADIAEKMVYTADKGFVGEEVPVSKETDHIYGFNGLNRKEIDTKLKGVKKYKHPEVFIFETDVNTRESNLKQIADLNKWYPKVNFSYVGLVKGIIKIKDSNEIKRYTNKRFENILSKSNVDKKVKRELYIETNDLQILGAISPAEFELFKEEGTVSKSRKFTIADKVKTGGFDTLSDQEKDMYMEHQDEIDLLVKK